MTELNFEETIDKLNIKINQELNENLKKDFHFWCTQMLLGQRNQIQELWNLEKDSKVSLRDIYTCIFKIGIKNTIRLTFFAQRVHLSYMIDI